MTLKTLLRAVKGGFGGLAATALLAGPAFAQAPAPALSEGNTAWMIMSTVLVLLMIVPGLALFYGGLVRSKNMLSVLTQVLAVASLTMIIWIIYGYSLAFTAGNAFIGGFSKMFLAGVTHETVNDGGSIPEYVFLAFQMTFAAITPALIIGGLVERTKFSAILLFMLLWVTFVYYPLAHMVWHADGYLMKLGALDFAGGTVVHINAGIAGLVGCIIVGKRKGYGHVAMAPHNLTLSMIGASLLWVGWFGFNAGSAAASNGLAGAAMINTQVATAGAALAWMIAEWIIAKKPSLLGIISGAVAGLVAITPAAGFVNPTGGLIIGLVAGVICYIASVHVKKALGYDDSLDVFGVHGVGGIVGAILTGVFADAAINAAGKDASVATQFYGVIVTIVYTAIVTAIIMYVVKAVIGLRPTEAQEEEGLDITLHGETVQ